MTLEPVRVSTQVSLMAKVVDVRFEHYHAPYTIGVHETRPKLSWNIIEVHETFEQHAYEVQLSEQGPGTRPRLLATARHESGLSILVPWPFDNSLQSRQKISIRVRVCDHLGTFTAWSDEEILEIGLLSRSDWACERITAPWALETLDAAPEHLYRKTFQVTGDVEKARLYITAQGLYEAEINGRRIGEYFMAPGWTTYDHRLQYQTYDVTSALFTGANCIGARIAEGWFCGRIGFEGGHRNIWGKCPALLAQLEITYKDGRRETIGTDGSWRVDEGPIRLAEIYDGEKYDGTLENPGWSSATTSDSTWKTAVCLPRLPESTSLTCGFGEAVRRIETISPLKMISTPSGKTIIDFGQNLVGYVRLRGIRGPRGHKITIRHAEVLEGEELGTRSLRICKATDQYTLKGGEQQEMYEPRFTFHGFRYVQIDNWPANDFSLGCIQAVVCHTDMKLVGSFECSDALLNRLYQNICWGIRGNFLSVPTDCPQRDERLGWTGDIALFAPTGLFIYDCFNLLKNWLIDVEYDQSVLGGVPPMVSPNSTLPDPIWCRRIPCAIWHDATILVPWALYEETGDKSILAQQYESMLTWMKVLPRNKTGSTHLWDTSIFQLGDWLDPAAPPDRPWQAATDAKMVANMFLIHSLELMAKIAQILGHKSDRTRFETDLKATRAEFHEEYVTSNGRIVSDSQAAYALAICFDIFSSPAQKIRAGNRLVELVRKAGFKIGTGFAGTPFLCEALASAGHIQVAYSMLLETKCPSWLYPVTMGATTVWERWDSMLPDGSINPGEMTSFNHYAFGAVAKFLYERAAGLQRGEPGWKTCRVAPAMGAKFTSASASHTTPLGRVACSWKTTAMDDGQEKMELNVSIPYGMTVEIVLPEGKGERREVATMGEWNFETLFARDYEWPVLPLKPKS